MADNTKKNQPARQLTSLPSEHAQPRMTTSFNKMMGMSKMIVTVCAFAMVMTMLGCGYLAYTAWEAAQSRVYVVTEGGTVYAMLNMNDDPKARKIEIESHIRIFVNSMFAFDEGNYQEHIERGLNMIGNDGKTIINQYNDIDLHNSLIKNNMKVKSYVDSVWIKVDSKPYRARVFARQEYENAVSREQYFLWADMDLRDVSRTKMNVHGLKIENWNVVKAEKINE
jgi:hypothetical protein